ncbi:MAG: beta-lactamase family protein, partial [Bryobacteraceae bacterium]|nr:beta-lactamase family protein [Bryobacteraceae bacterium]
MFRREFLSSLLWAIRRERIDETDRIIRGEVARGVESVALHVEQGGEVIARGYGKAKADSVFLLASITKPMTAMAVMMLRDQGRLKLSDPVQKYLPEFRGGERGRVEIRHLLTHTSGLPDMLPENEALRKRHAPLREFVAGAMRTPLLFAPGERMQYQSTGILLAAEIVERLTRRGLR